MGRRWILPSLLLAAAASAAQAQAINDTGIPTETQQRLESGAGDEIPWDLFGLFGLVGLLGLRREHPEDSYHPTPVE
ncbi:MAG: WGxxGxxG family protein [Alphaproteobacteria bacterium]